MAFYGTDIDRMGNSVAVPTTCPSSYDNPGSAPVHLELLDGDHHSAAVNVRYRPVATT